MTSLARHVPRGGGCSGTLAGVNAGGSEGIPLTQQPAELYSDGETYEEKKLGLFPWMERHFCAIEGAICRCIGRVALHSWTGNWAMTRHVNHSIRCTTDAFGDDPRPHFAKFCSCWPGLLWPEAVIDGLNATFARKLVPRIEIGAADAGCRPEDDGAWMPCAIMNTRVDSRVLPDRLVPRLDPGEQQDTILRKLDTCHRIAGADQALRVLGVWPASAELATTPVKATSAPVCAVVYAPERGPIWDGRETIFCPTDPPHCLEETCECADEAHARVDLQAAANGTACWACVPPESVQGPPEPANRRPQSATASPVTGLGAPTPAMAGAAEGARESRGCADGGRKPEAAAALH
eukprot:CAMPEP_0179064938 /NCGR_PEP_ID=MMETSP0796-20121207/28201_1 /TAXON_ID=73915 /ORGANISM="Pyrodinium bahamense, Strain pbaha01" /LENGTH=349 /DNA_ID=CAMNT_0020761891 /DNA_START=259 /DNA_END=1306 /DNA_ORIENTATION=-